MQDIKKSGLATGLLWQDEQHAQLFSLLRQVHEAIQLNDNRPICDVLLQLQYFTHEHFTQEETYMVQGEYPLADNHISEHNRFRSLILNAQVEWREAKTQVTWPDKADALATFLEFWLRHHIGQKDKALASFIFGLEQVTA